MNQKKVNTTVPEPRDRRADIDYIKAVAILAVVIMHAGGPIHAGMDVGERFMRQAWVNFHVPSFFVASGFLYYRPDPISWAGIGSRAVRLLVPYTVASILAALFLGHGTATLTDFFYRLATGGVVPIYYFVFDFALCIPLLWLLSRSSGKVVWAIWACLYAYVIAIAAGWLSTPRLGFYWLARDPFYQFWFGYFIAGWLVAYKSRSLVLPHWVSKMLPLLFLGAAAPYLYLWTQMIIEHEMLQPLPMRILLKSFYVFGVVGLISVATTSLRVPGVVRFLSEASFTLYLYHHAFQAVARPHLLDVAPMLRVVLLTTIGIAGASIVALVGRRTLGTRSRLLLGW